MYTLWFVENNLISCGFQLTSRNFYRVPEGRIHIVRYSTSFSPQDGMGYYGDTYFRQLIRKWKHYTLTKARRIQEKQSLALYGHHTSIGNPDILSHIGTFI